MKKYFILMASVALMLAVSCNKEEVNTPATSNETELITVQINPQTKTSLDGFDTIWSTKDAISVTVGGKNIGTLTYTGDENEFSGEVEAGHSGEAILNYPAGVTEVPAIQVAKENSFAEGAALLEGTTTMDALRAGKGATLNNTTALLKFTVAQAGDVTFEVGAAEYTVTGCETGNTYYACVAPAEDVSFKVTFDGYTIKEAKNTVDFTSSTYADLGDLPYNIYLHANTSKYNWTSDNARFATWTWGTDVEDAWLDMVAEGHEGVYRLEVPAGYNNLIFCRMDPDKVNDWGNVWNQTADLEIPTDNINHFYISGSASGAWGDKDYVFPVVKAVDGYLYLKPSSEWLQANAHFAAWIWKDSGSGKVYNFTKHDSVPGLYELNLNGCNKMIIFRMDPSKTVTDGSSDWPGDDQWYKSGDIVITGNMYTVIGWHEDGTGFSNVTEL